MHRKQGQIQTLDLGVVIQWFVTMAPKMVKFDQKGQVTNASESAKLLKKGAQKNQIAPQCWKNVPYKLQNVWLLLYFVVES